MTPLITNFPECPEHRTDCRFESLGGWVTLMHSPIIRDNKGRPVSGGSNVRTQGMECHICHRRWLSRQTELEDAQGRPRQWEEEKYPNPLWDKTKS